MGRAYAGRASFVRPCRESGVNNWLNPRWLRYRQQSTSPPEFSLPFPPRSPFSFTDVFLLPLFPSPPPLIPLAHLILWILVSYSLSRLSRIRYFFSSGRYVSLTIQGSLSRQRRSKILKCREKSFSGFTNSNLGFQNSKGPRSREAFIIDELSSFGSSDAVRIDAVCSADFQNSAGVRESNKGRCVPKMSNELRSLGLAHQQFRSRVDYARVYSERAEGKQATTGTIFAESSSDVFPIYRYFTPTPVIISYYCPGTKNTVRMRGTHTQQGRDFRTILSRLRQQYKVSKNSAFFFLHSSTLQSCLWSEEEKLNTKLYSVLVRVNCNPDVWYPCNSRETASRISKFK